jgi:hypothetical protein
METPFLTIVPSFEIDRRDLATCADQPGAVEPVGWFSDGQFVPFGDADLSLPTVGELIASPERR